MLMVDGTQSKCVGKQITIESRNRRSEKFLRLFFYQNINGAPDIMSIDINLRENDIFNSYAINGKIFKFASSRQKERENVILVISVI